MNVFPESLTQTISPVLGRWLIRFLVMSWLCGIAMPSLAADAARQTFCAQYATHAVEQFNILSRHAQCHADNNLRWQANYDNHYNGCLILPEFMAKAEEKTRDLTLHACGALNLDGTEATAQPGVAPAATPPGGNTNVPTVTAPPSAATSQATPIAVSNSAGSDPCKLSSPPYGPSALNHVEPGYGWKVGNGQLSYLDINTHQMRSYQVLRPAYFLNFIKCAHAPLPPAGAYVSQNGMLFLLNDQGSVLAYQVAADVLAKLLDGAQPSTDSAAGPGSADPGKAVLQIGGTITPPSGNNGVPCSNVQAPSFSLHGGSFGIGGKINGSTLTYQDMNAPHSPHTYSVQRPGYYLAATSCMTQTSNSGPWVSGNPGMFFILYDNGNVTANPVDAGTLPKLLDMPH